MFVVLSSCMLMCVCVCARARAGRAMLLGHSVNDLCKFLLPIPKKKQKGGCFKRVATFCSLALWRAALEGDCTVKAYKFHCWGR